MRDPHERPANFLLRQLEKVRHQFKDPLTDWRFADDFLPDAIVVSDPGTYYFISVPGLIPFLMERDVPFFISQYNHENAYLSEHAYREARTIFAKASRCFFVSGRNLSVARRQLCCDLSQALLVHNPPNLRDWSYVPFPTSQRSHYCMLARLDCAIKDQALVFQVLSEPVWRKRDWSVSIFGEGRDETYLRDLIEYVGLRDKVQMRALRMTSVLSGTSNRF
jgi:hypothetical protein